MSSTLKLSIAIFFALISVIAVVVSYDKLNEYIKNNEMRPYAEVKNWAVDSADFLKANLSIKTRYADGGFDAIVELDKYPAYLSDPIIGLKNRDRSLFIIFLDKDGFELYKKQLEISTFTKDVDENGRPVGLRQQVNDLVSFDKYKKFDSVKVNWNLILEVPKPIAPPIVPKAAKAIEPAPSLTTPKVELPDHCAPGLTRDERLRRLALRGSVRQTSADSFRVGFNSIDFYLGNNLLSCQ